MTMIEHTVALPDYTDTDAAKRRITYTWERPNVAPWDEGGLRLVELHVSHDKDRKRITAGLTLTDKHQGFVQTRIAPGMWLTIVSEPCPRYSAKALQTTATVALTALAANMDDARVQALMAGRPFDR